MIKIDPKKLTQILFDGASNVQKAGQCMAQHYRRAEVNHGAEHVVALVVEKFVYLPSLKEHSKFAKLFISYLSTTFLNFIFLINSLGTYLGLPNMDRGLYSENMQRPIIMTRS
jgi:hypothetical protein